MYFFIVHGTRRVIFFKQRVFWVRFLRSWRKPSCFPIPGSAPTAWQQHRNCEGWDDHYEIHAVWWMGLPSCMVGPYNPSYTCIRPFTGVVAPLYSWLVKQLEWWNLPLKNRQFRTFPIVHLLGSYSRDSGGVVRIICIRFEGSNWSHQKKGAEGFWRIYTSLRNVMKCPAFNYPYGSKYLLRRYFTPQIIP